MISDAVGKVVRSQNLKLQAGFNNVNLSASWLVKGSYFMKIILTNGKTVVQKIVKSGK